MRNTRDVLGHVGHLKQTTDVLLRQIQAIENQMYGNEELTAKQSTWLASVDHWAEGAKQHIETATQYAISYHDGVIAALATTDD